MAALLERFMYKIRRRRRCLVVCYQTLTHLSTHLHNNRFGRALEIEFIWLFFGLLGWIDARKGVKTIICYQK